MEFLFLLLATLFIAIGVSFIVVRFFRNPVDKIFRRIIGDEIAEAWAKFLIFALYVVGVASGVNIRKLEQFIKPETIDRPQTILTPEYWGLSIYETIIHTLGGMAWALLIFFIIALISFAIVRTREHNTPPPPPRT